MPIDPSIIPTKQTLPDFAGNVQGLLALQQRNTQLQQQRQQLAANAAVSDAIQKATDPTGNINIQSALSSIAQNPAAAYNLPDTAAKLYSMQNARLEGARKQLDYWDSQLGGLRTLGDKVTQDDVIRSLARGMSTGMIDANTATQYAQEIPNDPAKLQDWIKTHWVSLQDSKNQMSLLTPQNQVVNTGGQTQVLNIDPLTGKPKIAATLQNTLSPEVATSPVSLTTPGGTPYAVTREQFASMASGGGSKPVAGTYSGRPQQDQQAPTDVPAGGVQTGLSPAEQARQTSAASAQAQQATTAAQDLHNSASDVPMRINLLNQARQALEGINTGPGTDWRNTAKSFFNAVSPDMAKKIGWSGDVKDYDEFKKILTNYASSVSGALGGGTDARLNAAITGNANPNISKLANDDILVKTIAAEKMRAAQDYAFQNSGLSTDKFNQWQSQWNKNVNPDAFAFAEMNPQQQQDFINRQKKAGTLNKFKTDLGSLVRAGILELPTGGQ